MLSAVPAKAPTGLPWDLTKVDQEREMRGFTKGEGGRKGRKEGGRENNIDLLIDMCVFVSFSWKPR